MRFVFKAGAPAPAAPHQPPARMPPDRAAAPVARQRPDVPGSRRPPAAPKRPTTSGLQRGAVAVAASLALAGCATPVRDEQALAWKVEPVLDVKHGAQPSMAYYALGRYHDGSQAWDKAIHAYRKAIAANPRNAEAHNALGVLLARCQRRADAEAALRQALAIAPDSAHVRSNLGRVLLLAGRPQEAASELTSALQLDPGNPVAQANLREALAPSAQAPSNGAISAEPQAAEVQTVEEQAAEGQAAEVKVAEVPAAEPQAAEAPAPATLPVIAPPLLARIRLELSNGNGMRGAAARLKPQLLAEGLTVDRLTNQRPYVQRMTVIQYRAGQHDAAQRVADALRTTAPLEVVHGTGPGPDVRVVLGHDWARAPALTAWASR